MTDISQYKWPTPRWISIDPTKSSAFVFHATPAPTEVIRIDAHGFHYRGQFIEDAGEAHRLLVEFLRAHQPGTDWKAAND